MHTIIKSFFVLLFISGIFSICFAQVEDSLIVRDSTISDTSYIPDSTAVIVNKDSLNAIDSLGLMEKKFDQFKYGDVISIANSLLLKKVPFTHEKIIDIYKMKGIAHYSLSEDDAAKKSFIEILRIDSTYKLDSTKVSPKIISFYRNVKNDYVQQQKEIEARTVVRIDTVYVPKIEYDYEYVSRLKGAIVRSLIIPGLGQLYNGEYVKGGILTLLSSTSLVFSVYYIIDTNQKEKAYLVETNPGLIETKYKDYNSSYKTRNISLISFGILWLYSEIDLLFLSGNKSTENNIINGASISYSRNGLSFNIRYSF